MKLTAARAELAEAVKWVNGAISTRPPVPALAGLSMVATVEDGAGRLTITGHDYDQVHEATIDAEVDEPGALVPVGLQVRDLLGLMKGDRVQLAADAKGMAIKAGRSAYTVACFDTKDWPTFPANAIEPRGTVEADELRRCMSLAGVVGDDENPVTRLRGVRLEAADDELVVVGLQSTHCGAGFAGWTGGPFDSQVPARNLGPAIKALSGPVTIASSDSALMLTDAGHRVTLRIYAEADYPQWRQILTPGTQVVEVEAEMLRDAVRRAAVAGLIIETSVGDGVINVTTAGDTASGSEAVDCTGDGAYLASWTADVLLSVLGTLPSTEVTLAFGLPEGRTTGNPPMLVTDKAGSFAAVVMPRRAA
jgi:DNA polymerase-3 subunit beta